jgi:hypothetical protein
MTSPLIELQQHVLDQEVPASTLVRYALLIATRVKDVTMIEWCGHELNGYKSKPEGDYRTAYGEYMGTDDWNRDLPITVEDPRMLDIVTKVPIWMSVGEIETMLDKANPNSAFKMFLPPELEAKMRKGMSPPVRRLFRVVQQQQLTQVLGAVRNRLFDWTIELQTRGVAIDGEFPKLPGEKIKGVTESPRTIQTTNYVEVREAMQSPVQVGTKDSTQQIDYREGVDLEQVSKLVSALEGDLARLRPQGPDVQKLAEELETIKHLLKSPAPKHSWLRESLQSVRNILENAAGTVLGEVLKDAPYVAQIGRIVGMS